MEAWPKEGRASMNAFYGDPDPNHDGIPDRAWEDANLVSITPPYRMVLAWAPNQAVKTIRCHKKVAPSLLRVLNGILVHYGSQAEIEKARMHLYGGAYNFRMMRGGSALSIHSWGAAIDLDPERNAFGRRYDETHGMIPHAVCDLFAAEGWVWGGRWNKADAMHFQCATI